MKRPILAWFSVFAFSAVVLAQSAQPVRRLTNDDVAVMVKSSVSPEIIIAKIQSSPNDFDTSPKAIEQLKADGVPDNVVLAMVEASASAKPSLQAAAEKKHLPGEPTIYLEPENGFETYLAAAILKKEVPAELSADKANATYVLDASQIKQSKESTGSKLTRCLFAYCTGIEDKAQVSVRLMDSSSKIVWAYAVNKQRGNKNLQSMAEAVAKHLKNFLVTLPAQ